MQISHTTLYQNLFSTCREEFLHFLRIRKSFSLSHLQSLLFHFLFLLRLWLQKTLRNSKLGLNKIFRPFLFSNVIVYSFNAFRIEKWDAEQSAVLFLNAFLYNKLTQMQIQYYICVTKVCATFVDKLRGLKYKNIYLPWYFVLAFLYICFLDWSEDCNFEIQ